MLFFHVKTWPWGVDVVSLWSGWMWMVLELVELIMKHEYEYV